MKTKEQLLDWITKNKKNNEFAENLVKYLKLNVADEKDNYSGIKLTENALLDLSGKQGEITAYEAIIQVLSEE